MKTWPAKLWKDRNSLDLLFDYLLWRGFEEVGGRFLSPFTTALCGSTIAPLSFPLFTATSIFLDPIPPSCEIVWTPQHLCKWSMSKTNNTRRALVFWKLMTMFSNTILITRDMLVWNNGDSLWDLQIVIVWWVIDFVF